MSSPPGCWYELCTSKTFIYSRLLWRSIGNNRKTTGLTSTILQLVSTEIEPKLEPVASWGADAAPAQELGAPADRCHVADSGRQRDRQLFRVCFANFGFNPWIGPLKSLPQGNRRLPPQHLSQSTIV